MTTPDWSFGGTSLTSAGAYNFTVIDTAEGLRDRRGRNPVIPMQEGSLFIRKYVDEGSIILGMNIWGATQGSLEVTLDALKKLFGSQLQQTLIRTMADGTTRTALADVTGTMQVKKENPSMLRAAVEFKLSGGFMRSSTLTTQTTTINTSPKTWTLTNPGTAEDRTALITFAGPLSFPKLTNTGETPNVYVAYNAAIGSGHSVVIDSRALTCKLDGASDLNNFLYSGDVTAFVLRPGSNPLKGESNVTGGTFQIDFYAPFH